MGSPEDVGKGPMMEWTLVIESGRMWAPGSGSSLGGWGYLCGGSLEEGMEEQIAKAEWWCLQEASHVHPDGGPDAETSIPVKQEQRGLGGRPAARFLSLCLFLPQYAQVPSPQSLGLCLRSSHLTFSQGQPPTTGSSSPAHHPLLPGVSQPPCPGGEKPMGAG